VLWESVSGRLGDSVWAFSVLILLVEKVLVDLGVGVVCPYGRCCASWLLELLVWANRRVGPCWVCTTVQSLLFVIRYRISILDWEAVPQRGIPYVHIGRNIVLYSRSLFSIDNSECSKKVSLRTQLRTWVFGYGISHVLTYPSTVLRNRSKLLMYWYIVG
jgi:hypothetical protein